MATNVTIPRADLRPYVSLTVARSKTDNPDRWACRHVLDDVEQRIADDGFTRTYRANAITDGALTVGHIVYRERHAPAWLIGDALEDVEHHLVVVALYRNHLAILCSASAFGESLAGALGLGSGEGLDAFSRVGAGQLNAAFAQGSVRTLWLSGVHARTKVKADAKILSGIDLRDALNPLDDQTYYFSAGRWLPDPPAGAAKTVVGVSPRKSRVWTGKSANWDSCKAAILDLLQRLDAAGAQSVESPLPVLASPVSSLASVSGAYDLSITVPEFGPALSEEEWRDLAWWADNAAFDVRATAGADFEATVRLAGQPIGVVAVSVTQQPSGKVSHTVSAVGNASLELDRAIEKIERADVLTVRYESNHTLSDGHVFATTFRDVESQDLIHFDFTGFDVTKEKPTRLNANGHQEFDPTRIGHSNSLFCWVWKTWKRNAQGVAPGWIACDDGAGEIADFIYVDLQGQTVELIHIKGSGNGDANRSLSASEYEVVTNQAVKNLRALDRDILARGLQHGARSRIGPYVRRPDGTVGTRAQMVAAMAQLRASATRSVVVLQPRVTQQALTTARQAKAAGNQGVEVKRLLQLETILVAAGSACRDLGAKLTVIAAR